VADDVVALSEWLPLIRGEFSESPGLCLTRLQLQRWWSLDRVSCDAVIDILLADGFLRPVGDGTYRKRGD
jgi:hypothetical protein